MSPMEGGIKSAKQRLISSHLLPLESSLDACTEVISIGSYPKEGPESRIGIG